MDQRYYDAVVYFRRAPGEVRRAWAAPWRHPHGALFACLTPSGRHCLRADGRPCGCPVSVAAGRTVAWTDALTREARGEHRVTRALSVRLPPRASALKDPHLQALALLQTRLDETLRDARWRHEHGVPGEWDHLAAA